MADNMPDFDKMSPEELMLWMESLAKRQGATEGMTTSADLEIAEIDPDTVVLDEPGYVPSEGKSKGQSVLPPAKKQPAPAAAAPAAPPPTPEPPAPVIVEPPAPAIERPAASIEPPVLESFDLGVEESETEVSEPVAAENAMAWLESLAADQGSLPELDLSGLGAEIEPVAVEPAAPSDPIKWLEGLAESQGEPAQVAANVSDPFAGGVDPMNWLESLAKRQGAKGEELLTDANLQVPETATSADAGPGYSDYSVDAPPAAESAEPATARVSEPAAIDPSELESPADWLDSLASGQGFTAKAAEPSAEEDNLSDDAMREALRSGKEIAPEEMEAWFNRQLDRGFERDEPELPDEDEVEEAVAEYDPEAPAVPAALPDWLSEMAPAPPEPPKAEVTEQQAFIEQIVEPPAVPDMPDWLKEEVSAHSDLDLDNIFASTEAAAPSIPAAEITSSPAGELEVDHSDPWVEAFDHEQGIITLPDLPSPAVPAALEEAKLEAEEELPAGQPEPMPDWLSEAAESEKEEEAVIEPGEMPDWLSEAAPSAAEPVSAAEVPDWLKEVGAEVELHEIPDWLKETGDTEEQVVIPSPAPAPAATTPVTVPPVTAISPAPVPLAVALSAQEAVSVLSSARNLSQSDVDAGLAEYEKLVRANVELDAVVSDLTQLVARHDKNPGVYRVLGDGLMRNGQLQAALDTYRKALNLL